MIYKETLKEINRQAKLYPNIIKKCGSLRIASNKEELIDCMKQY